jgi:dihydrofolate reductase
MTKEIKMRKLVAGLFVTLDGVVEAPERWQFPYFNEEIGAILGGQLAASDALMLGRRTFQDFAQFWPSAGDVPFAAHMNSVAKYVVTTDEAFTPGWAKTTVLSSDLPAVVERLKGAEGLDIQVTGSATLVRSLVEDNLLDELRLLVCPVVVGKGGHLFPDGFPETQLELLAATPLSTGVLSLTYRPAAA